MRELISLLLHLRTALLLHPMCRMHNKKLIFLIQFTVIQLAGQIHWGRLVALLRMTARRNDTTDFPRTYVNA